MTGEQFHEARIGAALSFREAAEALGVSLSTIQRWEKGESAIPSDAAERITALARRHRPELARTLGRLCRVLEDVTGKPLPRDVTQMLQGKTAEAFGLLFRRCFEAPEQRRAAHEPEIMALTDLIAEIPDRLSNEEMAAFWLGYYGRGGAETNNTKRA